MKAQAIIVRATITPRNGGDVKTVEKTVGYVVLGTTPGTAKAMAAAARASIWKSLRSRFPDSTVKTFVSWGDPVSLSVASQGEG